MEAQVISPTLDLLATALCEAQGEMPSAPMDGTNPHYHSKYATLGSLILTAKPILTKFGLSLSQFPISIDGKIGLRTILMHKSGQHLEDVIMLAAPTDGRNSAQELGKIITYLRRYAYASVLGMYADEDTDAEGAPTITGRAAPPAHTREDLIDFARPLGLDTNQIGEALRASNLAFDPNRWDEMRRAVVNYANGLVAESVA